MYLEIDKAGGGGHGYVIVSHHWSLSDIVWAIVNMIQICMQLN